MELINSLPMLETFTVVDKSGRKAPLKLYDSQRRYLRALHTYRYVFNLKRRQIGCSTITGGDTLVQLMGIRNFTTLVFSIGEREAAEYLQEKCWQFTNDLTPNLKEILLSKDNLIKDNTLEKHFKHSNSRIICFPCTSTAGSSYTANRVIIDECFKIKNLEDLLASVAPALEKTGGQLILQGTAFGMGYAQSLYMRAKRRENNFHPVFMGAFADPSFTPESWDKVAKDFGEDHAKQEYPRTAEEAFISSGSPRFIAELINKDNPEPLKPLFRADLDVHDRYQVSKTGNIMVYDQLDKYGSYLITADVSEGLEKGDYSNAKVFDRKTWQQVAEWHGHIEHAAFGLEAVKLARHYNNADIAIECNNHGVASITEARHHYPEELLFKSNYTAERPDDKFKTPEKRFGWYTSTKTKIAIIDNMAQLIIDTEMPRLTAEDISELTTYVKDKRGSTNATDGCYDDRVMTLAIGMYLLPLYPPAKFKDGDSCFTCSKYSRNSKECRLTGRYIGDEVKWCGKYAADFSRYEEAIPANRFKVSKKSGYAVVGG